MSPISPFGWNDNAPPDIDTANLEAMHAASGAYTDSQVVAEATARLAAIAAERTRAETAEGTLLVKAANLSDVANAVTARASLGLGTAATHASTDFDAAGSATTEQARAEAAEGGKLAKASNLSDLPNAATARTNLGLGSAATHPATDFDTAGAAAAAQAASVPLSQKGAAGGVATLDDGTRLPAAELPLTAVTGWALFRPEDYGAGTTADDAKALQECWDAAAAVPKARIILGLEYHITSAPRTDYGGNACVCFPNYKAGGPVTQIRIEGAVGGTNIKYEGPACTYSAEHGAPSVIGGPTSEVLGKNANFSRAQIEMYGITVQLPVNPTIGGIDLSRVGKIFGMDNVTASAGGQPTHVWSFGIRLPESDNGSMNIGQVTGHGCYVGVVMNSALGYADKVTATECVVGLGITGNEQYAGNDGHSAYLDRLDTQHCNNHIASWSPTEGAISLPTANPAQLVIALWDIEDGKASEWFKTEKHLLDANNVLYGTCHYGRVVAFVGKVSGALTVSGGLNFARQDVTATPKEVGDIFGITTIVTATNAAWPIPNNAKTLEITAVGGGGGGGGGGSSSATAEQKGGAGGTAGGYTTQVVTVGANTTLDIKVGAGGKGGAGGAAGGKAGSTAEAGKDTTVTGTGIAVVAKADGRGQGSGANSAANVLAVIFGNQSGNTRTFEQNQAAEGGGSGKAGGVPWGWTGGGGGGGGTSSATLGGGASAAGSKTVGGAGGTAGSSATTAGEPGASAEANTSAGGGGGGGGAWNAGAGPGAGGKGGDGGSGFVIVRVVG